MDKIFDCGAAYTLGRINGDTWYVTVINPGTCAKGLLYSVCVCSCSNFGLRCPRLAATASKSQLEVFNLQINVSFKSYGVISLFDCHWRSLWITDMKIGTYNTNYY